MPDIALPMTESASHERGGLLAPVSQLLRSAGRAAGLHELAAVELLHLDFRPCIARPCLDGDTISRRAFSLERDDEDFT
jgi:hypothetical protein